MRRPGGRRQHYPAVLDLEVRDSGIGIHADDLQRLFNPFIQANPHSQSARAGTGLGLAICRNLCEMMGGSLTIKSLEDVGAGAPEDAAAAG